MLLWKQRSQPPPFLALSLIAGMMGISSMPAFAQAQLASPDFLDLDAQDTTISQTPELPLVGVPAGSPLPVLPPPDDALHYVNIKECKGVQHQNDVDHPQEISQNKFIQACSKQVIRALRSLLQNHENADIRSSAISVLGQIGQKAVPTLIDALEDQNPDVRTRAVITLGNIGPEAKAAVPALTSALKDQDVRHRAAYALGQIGPAAEPAIPPLIKALKFEFVGYENEKPVAFALAQIGSPAVPELIKALKTKEGSASAAYALGKIGPETVPELINALKHKESQAPAIFALWKIGPEATAAVPELLDALQSTDAVVRGLAAYTLGEIAPSPEVAGSQLTVTLQDPDATVRLSAAIALVKIMRMDATAAIPALIEGIKTGDGAVDFLGPEYEAFRTLGPSAVSPLIDVLKSEDKRDRKIAAVSLGAIGTDAADAVPALVAALQDQEQEVRHEAVIALERIGPLAQAAISDLEAMMNNPDESVDLRLRADTALGQIKGFWLTIPLEPALPALNGVGFFRAIGRFLRGR